MSLDVFFNKKYDVNAYNCANFAAEVWEHLTGQDIEERLACFLKPKKERTADMKLRHDFFKLDKPVSPCLVLFTRPRKTPHAGVFYKRRIIHITKKGVQNLPVCVVGFNYSKINYYGVSNG